jgi:O-antigen/teichoic acid export membrane protein
VVSLGNFLLNVLLARVLSEADYGIFVLFLGAIYVMRALDYSLISYPLSVRLCGAAGEERPRLLGNTILLVAGLSLTLVAVMALGVTLLQVGDVGWPACLCFLCWQAQETSRRCLLADFRYRAAVAGDGASYVGQALLIASLAWLSEVTLPLALYVMSATFVIGAVVHASKLRTTFPDVGEARGLAREYFAVGKWSLVTYQLVLLRSQMFPWVLAGVAGTVATASFQAAANIAAMMAPITLGIGNAIPQVASQAHRDGGVVAASRAASGYVLFGLAPILVICAAGVLMPETLLRAVYGPASPYLAAGMGVQLLVVAGVLDYVADAANKTLLGVRAGGLASLTNCVAVGAAAVLAFAMIGRLGVLGACLGLLIASLVRVSGAVIAIAWLLAVEKPRVPGRSATDSTPLDGAVTGAAEREAMERDSRRRRYG